MTNIYIYPLQKQWLLPLFVWPVMNKMFCEVPTGRSGYCTHVSSAVLRCECDIHALRAKNDRRCQWQLELHLRCLQCIFEWLVWNQFLNHKYVLKWKHDTQKKKKKRHFYCKTLKCTIFTLKSYFCVLKITVTQCSQVVLFILNNT